ncbi:RND family efflux transporter, MFP subunit [Alkalithermobacter thermoalcaliphilus JW-YL-7 = DSM 7308]|uniref:Efflux transporter, RND family, MFP subunit n=1 Tax=Alkalithermobacter thermoalcaliphilus JW-YL-7 = DSM 7308 TaxID=1121328 RepID=A0A150FU44_CLOPD|nr:efflux transporter, RND family, MFP subunit [[Clostridium] paradoxum JW-YL-7 = DSM 7308]SHK70983.1 RND family efflux transporter, MFP subunit [[Clostridium] paradoxum JW-YL-7 = DSM 7308]
MKKLMLIILCAVFVFSGCQKQVEQLEQETLQSVKTYESKAIDLSLRTDLTGKVVPFERVNLSPKMPGKVSSINVNVGDKVKKGDILFTLDQKDILNAIAQAQASYDLALASYENIKNQVKVFDENYERMKKMFESGFISKEELEKYEMSRANLPNLDIAKLQLNQSKVMLDNAKSNIEDTIIRSPISGVVTSINVNVGEIASSAVFSVVVMNIDKVYVDVNVSESLVNRLNVGDSVDIYIDSVKADPFKAKIKSISISNTMTYPVRIELDNSENLIKPGMNARVSFVTEKRESVLAVPSSAVVVKNGESVVFIVENDKAIIRPVKIGIDNGEYVEIVEGLVEGESVVVKGQEYLEDKSKVVVVE